MRSLLLAFALVLGSFSAIAAEDTKPAPEIPFHYDFFFYNPEIRYERDTSQQMVSRQPLNLALGLRRANSTWIFEYSRMSTDSGNSTLSISRRHQEYSLWWNQNVWNFELVNFFASVGVGGYQEDVTTALNGASTKDSGAMELMGGSSAGIKSLLWHHLIISLEGRLLAGQDFDPNPQASILLRFGAEF